MTIRPAAMSWSSGKDSTMALHLARQNPELEIVALFSSFNEEADRVAIHGTRREIARAQANVLDLPLFEVDLPAHCTNEVYEALIGEATRQLKDDGVHDWVFGDLFLEDIRKYREENLSRHGLSVHFPLWGSNTHQLSQQMLEVGVEAHIVTLDPKHLPEDICGKRYDKTFLDNLPETVDPCGENGEFHTVVSNGPGFNHALELVQGETVTRSGFVYTDFTLQSSISN